MSLNQAIDRLAQAASKGEPVPALAARFREVAEILTSTTSFQIRLAFNRLNQLLADAETAGYCDAALPLIDVLSTRIRQSALFSRAEVNEIALGRTLLLVGAARYPEALQAAEELEVRSDLPLRIQRALSVHIGSLHSLLGSSEAVPRLRAALNDLASDEDEPLFAKTSLDLARAITESGGDPREAETLLRAALPSIERHLAGTTAEAFVHDILGRSLSLQGRYFAAREEFERALSIVEALVGPHHPLYATALLNLSQVFYMQGDYLRTEELLDQAEAIGREFGKEGAFLVDILYNRAEISAHTGDIESAERYATEALQYLDRVQVHPAFRAGALMILASAAEKRHEYETARSYYLSAEPLLAETPYADSVSRSLASLDLRSGELDRALQRYTALLDAYMHRGTEGSFEYLGTLLSLAQISLARQSWSEAKELANRVFDMMERSLGSHSIDLVPCLSVAACAHIGLQEYDEAARVLQRAADLEDRYLVASLGVLPTARQIELLRRFRQTLEMAVSLHLDYAPDNPTCARISTEMLLRRKGLYLEIARTRASARDDHASDEDQRRIRRLHEIHQALTHHIVRPALTHLPTVSPQVTRSLIDERDALEKQLASRGSPIARPSSAAVAAALRNGAAYVDYLFYSTVDPAHETPLQEDGNAFLAAFWFTADGAAGITRIAAPTRLLDQIDAFRAELRHQGEYAAAHALYRELLGPLPQNVARASHLRISPDQYLWFIPFAALAPAIDRLVVADTAISYVDSAYDLLPRPVTPPRQGVVIVANPDFYAEIETEESGEEDAWRPLSVPEVPGGAMEEQELKTLFPSAEIWSGPSASKPEMIGKLHGPIVLHIITHGKFVSEHLASGLKSQRSLLTLAGFNHGVHGVRHGALTASEAALLDLDGSELVTLSACVSGIGVPEPAQANSSLRTAFQIAGARSQLVSLWPVPGLATSVLMTRFYGRLALGYSRETALHLSQKELAEKTPPYFWAGFVLFGATGSIAISTP